MKNIILYSALLYSTIANAQVVINKTNNQVSSNSVLLEFGEQDGKKMGLALPRVTSVPDQAQDNHVPGTLFYDMSTHTFRFKENADIWQRLTIKRPHRHVLQNPYRDQEIFFEVSPEPYFDRVLPHPDLEENEDGGVVISDTEEYNKVPGILVLETTNDIEQQNAKAMVLPFCNTTTDRKFLYEGGADGKIEVEFLLDGEQPTPGTICYSPKFDMIFLYDGFEWQPRY